MSSLPELPDVFAEHGLRGVQRVLRRGRAKERPRLEPHPLGGLSDEAKAEPEGQRS